MATRRLIRWIPRLVIGAAALHVLLGLANTAAFTAIASAGFVDTLMVTTIAARRFGLWPPEWC
ncbi:MAG TPA: hypothetical protein VK453_03880 [Micromonosporaceae bacterium]|nr:hypothetical protein [Micromonosporaceae bacterium]